MLHCVSIKKEALVLDWVCLYTFIHNEPSRYTCATSLHIEMDSKEIVGKLKSKERDMSTLGPMIEEVKQMLETRQRWKVTWVRRTANSAAHGLAKEGVLNN